jgi:hypothetical protein
MRPAALYWLPSRDSEKGAGRKEPADELRLRLLR